MNNVNLEPKSETSEIDGHVVTRGCVFHAELNRWEPTVTIRPAWASSTATSLESQAEHFQDTPEDAMGVARDMAHSWLIDHDPRTGQNSASG